MPEAFAFLSLLRLSAIRNSFELLFYEYVSSFKAVEAVHQNFLFCFLIYYRGTSFSNIPFFKGIKKRICKFSWKHKGQKGSITMGDPITVRKILKIK